MSVTPATERYTAAAARGPLLDVDSYDRQLRAAASVAVEATAAESAGAVVALLREHVALAPAVLGGSRGEDALRAWFDAVVALCAEVGVGPADVAASITAADTHHQRAAFAAVLADDFDFFRDRDASSSRVVAGDLTGADVVVTAGSTPLTGPASKPGQLLLDVPLPEHLRPLLVVGRLRARLERVRHDADRDVLVLDGRAWVPGTSPERPLENAVRLRVAGSKDAVAVTPQWRPSSASAAGEWRGFTAEVPVADLADGVRGVTLTVVAESAGGAGTVSQDARAVASSGYLRRSREITAPGLGVLPGADAKGRAVLTLFSGGGERARRRWRRLLLRQDVSQWLRRRPFGSVRVARLVTAPFFRHREIWLVGERVDTAQDNGLHMFRHLRGELGRKDVHYLISKDSGHRPLVEPFGNVVTHGGLRHRLYLLHAKVLLNSQDPDVFMLPEGWDRFEYRRHLAWRIGARRVFLQHGIIKDDVGAILQPSNTGFDLFVSGAEREADDIRATTGYTDEVRATGLPRYDALQPTPPSRTVLFMPTWRRYLVSPSYEPDRIATEPFEGSAYERFMRELLTSPALHAALEEHDYRLEFLAHYEIVDHVRSIEVPSERVVVRHPQERDVQTAIRECDVLVTDWSSVFFDAAYLGTPVVHAPFDAADFRLHYREGWFDPDRDGFGPVGRTPEAVVDHLRAYLANGAVREPVYAARADAFFTHRDRANAARVTAAVDALLA